MVAPVNGAKKGRGATTTFRPTPTRRPVHRPRLAHPSNLVSLCFISFGHWDTTTACTNYFVDPRQGNENTVMLAKIFNLSTFYLNRLILHCIIYLPLQSGFSKRMS